MQLESPFQICRVSQESRQKPKSAIIIDTEAFEKSQADNLMKESITPFFEFPIEEIKKLTTDRLYIQLFEINNRKQENFWTILGFNRRQQREFMGFVTRYGWKDCNPSILYNLIASVSRIRKNFTLHTLPLSVFTNYANKIFSFLKFIYSFPELRIQPHFLFNHNWARKIMFCINSIK